MHIIKQASLLNQTTRIFAGVFMGLIISLATFTQLSAQLSVSVASTDPTCAGYTNGTATASATGGVAPYTYRWSNGNTGAAISGLGAGTFTVTVTGANNATATGSATTVAATQLVGSSSFASICTGGAVTVSATGGTGPYTYNWGGGRVGATQSGLTGGGYNVTITDSKGCSINYFVNVPAPFTAALQIGELVCFGDCDAAINAVGAGGVGPYTYRWNTGATTGSIVGIPSGTYSVTITDQNGCTSNATGTVANPPVVTLTTTTVNPTCSASNGSATVSATGGRPPFSFRWSNGQQGTSATGLAVGTYFVTATDAKGCNKTQSVVLTSGANFTLNPTSTNASCGSSNGSASVAVSGGTGPFTYRWSTGGTGQTIGNLAAGTYTVTVADASGCSAVASTIVNAAGSLAVTMSSTNAACGIANGTATATPTSGTAPFRYAWSNGGTTQTIGVLGAGTYTVTVTDASGCTAIGSRTITSSSSFDVTFDARNVTCNGLTDGQATAMVSGGSAPYTYRWSNGGTVAVIANLPAGDYTVTVSDAGGCTGVKTVNISQPTAVTASIAATNASCSGANGAATVTPGGGTPGYTYAWTNGSTSNSISNIAAGSYTVTVTDSKGCRATATSSITAGTAIDATAAITNAVCSGSSTGAISLTTTGATGTVTYAWSNGATTPSVSGIASGTYSVTISDSRGCSAVKQFTVGQGSAGPTVTLATTDAVCSNNGIVAATASGSIAPYTYAWSTGATSSSITALAGGVYTVTVTDGSGCKKTNSSTVNAFTAPTVTLSSSNPTCNGNTNGSVTTSLSGGTSPFSYAWSNAAITANLANVGAGTYSVTVTDSKGCASAVKTATVTQPSAIVITTSSVTNATCLPVGSITVSASAGAGAPYTYAWSTGATTATISSMAGGNYTVTVTDANGCKNSSTINIPAVTSTITATIAITSPISYQGGVGEATVTATNGRAPYTYRWSNGSTLATATGLSAGTYTVTITDANGCTTTSSVTLTQPTCSNLTSAGTITGDQNYCDPASLTGILEATPAVGGTGALEYLWMYSDFTADFSAGGWNTIVGATGKDLPANLIPTLTRKTNFIRCVRRAGCGTYLEGNVIMKVPAVAFSYTAERFPCLNRANIFTAADNGTGATYSWTFQGANITSSTSRTPTVTFTSLGVKTITLTISQNGCTQTKSFPIEAVNCFGGFGTIFAFSASTTGSNGVRLNWATTDEKLTSKYMIEKSVDNVNFTLIGTITSQNLPNNLYSFEDPTPKMGRAFYRLHQMTPLDVEIAVSNTQRVTLAQSGQSLVTYPNPVGANLFVEVVDTDNTEGVIEIYTEAGNLVKVQKFTANQVRYEVDTNELGRGTYILKVRKADGSVSTTKISKF